MKDRRIEMRADMVTESMIVEAAATQHQSVSAFVLQAAVDAAEVVLARADHALMSTEQFDALMGSLSVPDSAPELEAVAAGERRFIRG